MRILSLVLGALLIITGVGLYVIETGVESNKSNTYIVIIAHHSIIKYTNKEKVLKINRKYLKSTIADYFGLRYRK